MKTAMMEIRHSDQTFLPRDQQTRLRIARAPPSSQQMFASDLALQMK
jgi:hypothetical protein